MSPPADGDRLATAAGAVTEDDADPTVLIETLRQQAAESVTEALAHAEASLSGSAEVRRSGAFLYFTAELHARVGNPHQALDLIDRAQRQFSETGAVLDAERCEIGRAAVLDDLGRIDEAIEAATKQLDRLAARVRTLEVVDLEVRALVNRGSCHETMGHADLALADYDLALAGTRLINDSGIAALVQINRSNVLDVLGRTSEALACLSDAIDLLEGSGDRDDRAKAMINLAVLRCRRGEYDDGLARFHTANELVEDGTVDQATVAVEVADVLVTLGAFDEAVARYRDALEVLDHTPLSWLEGRAWLGYGTSNRQLGNADIARQALRRSIEAFAAIGNLPGRLSALLELAAAEQEHEVTGQLAAEQAALLLDTSDVDRWPVQACLARLALANLRTGVARERELRYARRLAARVALDPLTMRVEQHLGKHLIEQGRWSEAAGPVERSVQLADTLSRRLRHGALLRSFPTQTAASYAALVELSLMTGDIERAATAADQARSRSLIDLGFGAEGSPSTPSATRETEAELHAVYDRLLGVDERAEPAVRRWLADRSHELERLLDRHEFEMRPITSERQELTGGHNDATTLELTYVERAGAIDLFVARNGLPTEWFPAVTTHAAVAELLAAFHTDGRRALALRSAGVTIPQGGQSVAERILAKLGATLLGPVADLLRSTPDRRHRLAVSPVGVVHSVPLAALMLGDVALIDLADISLCPSHAIRRRCAALEPALGRPIVVGCSEGGIRSAEVEAIRIARRLDRSVVLLGAAATVGALTAATDRPSLLHLASHGIFRPGAPLRSGVRLADGWLTGHRASQLDLRGTTVVLSACDTGRSTVTSGGDVLGLQYGFLAAGARHVVLSSWPAHDELTTELMTEFHRQLRETGDTVTALADAQRMVRSEAHHPWLWSGFHAVGG